MPKPAFDPNKPFESVADNSKPAFDPSQPFERAETGPGAGQSALEHFGNAASFGYLPQLNGLASMFSPNPSALLDVKLRASGTKINQPQPTYLSERDATIRRLQQESEEHPYASAAGMVGGALSSGAATNAIAPINAATRLGRVAQAARGSAIIGALSNPGDTEGEVQGLQLGDRSINAVKAGALGGVFQGGIEALTSAAKGITGLPKSLQNKAEERAFKSAGAMLKDYRSAAGKYEIDGLGLGEHLIENGISKEGASPSDIAQAIRDFRSSGSDGSIGQYLMDKGLVNESTGAKELSNTIRGFNQNRINAMGKFMLDNGLVKPGMNVSDIAEAASDLKSQHGKSVGSILEALDSAGARAPSHAEIAADIEKQALPLKGLKTSSPTFNALQDLADDIKSMGKSEGGSSFRGAQDVKSFISDQIEKTGGWHTPNPSEKNLALRQAYGMVRDKLEATAGSAAKQAGDDGLLQKYLASKSAYRNASDISKIAKDKVLRDNANRFFSPSDYAAGIGGAVVGAATGEDLEHKAKNVAMGLGLGLANKLGRTYGTPMVSTALNKAGNALARTPLPALGSAAAPILSAIEKSPASLAAVEGAVSRPSLSPSELPRVADSADFKGNRSPTGSTAASERWAKAGAALLGLSPEISAKVMADPKGMQLLANASIYPKGSKISQKIMDQIKKGWGQ